VEPTPTNPPVEEVRLITPIASSLVDVSIYLALANGIFEKHFLKVTHTAASGGGPDMQALLAGEVEFSDAYPGATVSAVAQGENVKAVMLANSQTVGAVLMRTAYAEEKGVTESSPLADKMKALDGAVIGVSTPSSFFAQLADLIIKEYNIQGAQILPLGGGATALAGLQQGQADALIYSPPVLQQAVMSGDAIWLARAPEIPALKDIAQSTLNVRGDYAAEHPDIVRRMIAALLESNQWILEHSAQEVVDAIRDQGFSEMQPEVLLQAVEMMQTIVDPDGCMAPANFTVVENLLLASTAISAPVPFEQVATNEYLPTSC
jgi:NitT/TauT family transport system substrate-binding protein